MAGCQCSNIEIMQLFHELKQKFPVVPDHIVTQCIHQNAHQRDLCENELEEENSRYLRHCFPQGLVDQMNPPPSPVPSQDEPQVYFERGYARRSLDSAQCSRRKSSSTSDDMSSVVSSKMSSKMSKKLGLGLPPKHAKRLYKMSGGKYGTGPSESGKHAEEAGSTATPDSKRRHSRTSQVPAAEIRMDHRGNLERYKKFDEIVAKGKYKKLTSELEDITNVNQQQIKGGNLGDVTMSEADQHKLCVAQQMLGLRECDSSSQGRSATNENRRSQQLSPRRAKHYSKVSPVSTHRRKGNLSHSPELPLISLDSPGDREISSNTRWNYQRSVSACHPPPSSPNTARPVDRGSLKLDLFPQQSVGPPTEGASIKSSPGNTVFPSNQMTSNQLFPSNQALSSNQTFSNNQSFPSNQTFPSNQAFPSKQAMSSNQVRLSLPSSSGNDVTSVSVLSYSAPTTPLSASSPLFPPLAVDVSAGGHRTSLSLEPLPHYGLSEDPARPLTKVTLSLRPPGHDADSPLLPGSGGGSGLTYTSYSHKDGMQAQLHISIGSNVSPTSSQPMESSSQTLESHPIPTATRNILNAQIERKAKLFNALMCERARLSAIQRDISSIEEKIKLQQTASEQKVSNVQSPRVSKLRLEVKALQEECTRLSKAANHSFAGPSGTPEPPGWICYMCTFLNHHMLPKCEQCDMLRVNLDSKLPASLPCT